MVDKAWKPVIQAQDCQWALAGASVDIPAVNPLLSGTPFKIVLHTPEAVSVYSV